jgi:antitoxin VapB
MALIEKARVFKNGRSQAVRIPAEYRFTASEVYIRRDPQTGEIILSERPIVPDLEEVFAMLDAARAADGVLELDRDESRPVEREWM